MKNLLDHLDTALAVSKSAALVVASGSPRGRMTTLSGVRHVLRALHVRAIIGQIAVYPQDRDPQSGQWLKLIDSGILACCRPVAAIGASCRGARRCGPAKRPFQKDCSARLKMFQHTSAQPSLRNAS